MFDDTLGSVEALVGPKSYRDVQKRRDLFQFLFLFFITQLYHEVTTTLFGDSMGLAHGILIRFLWILKGDFAATFRLSSELITINLTYGDQLIKGEDPVRGGQSSAFLLHAEEIE